MITGTLQPKDLTFSQLVIHSVSTYKGQRGFQTSLSQIFPIILNSHVTKFCLTNMATL